MLQNIIMPKLGDTMEEGTIANWLVKEGDTVNRGDIVMEVETDKVTLEVESLVSGMILKIIIPDDQTVAVGTIVAYVGNERDVLPEEMPPTAEPKHVSKDSGLTQPVHEITAQRDENRPLRRKTSPRAVELAQRLGVDIVEVTGSGPKGRITSKDVQNFYDGIVDKSRREE